MNTSSHDVLFQERLYQRLEHVVGSIKQFPEAMTAPELKDHDVCFGDVSFRKIHDDRERVVLELSQSRGEGRKREKIAFFLIDTEQKKAQAAPHLSYFKGPNLLELKNLEKPKAQQRSFLEASIADGFKYGRRDGLSGPLVQIGVDPRVIDVPKLAPQHRFGLFCNVYGEKLLRSIYEHGYQFQKVGREGGVAPELKLQKPMKPVQSSKPSFQVVTHRTFEKGEIIGIQFQDGRTAKLIATDLNPGERAKDLFRDVFSPSMQAALTRSTQSSNEEKNRGQAGKEQMSSQNARSQNRGR